MVLIEVCIMDIMEPIIHCKQRKYLSMRGPPSMRVHRTYDDLETRYCQWLAVMNSVVNIRVP